MEDLSSWLGSFFCGYKSGFILSSVSFESKIYLRRLLNIELQIIPTTLLDSFKEKVGEISLDHLEVESNSTLSVDFFQFYKSVSSVYSSKIEGENIEFDSYFKHKFMGVAFQPDYTKKADDLFLAYEYVDNQEINVDTLQKAHSILCRNLLPISGQGKFRTNPMYVINEQDRIEYVAAEPTIVSSEMHSFFSDLKVLASTKLTVQEAFYFAAMAHLVFVKIHPFQDGNGRTARLLEKWFLLNHLGEVANSIQLEKNYYLNVASYYSNIKKLGLEYSTLDYNKAMDFILMTVKGIKVGHG